MGTVTWAGRRERAEQESNKRVFDLSVFSVQCPLEKAQPRVCISNFVNCLQTSSYLCFIETHCSTMVKLAKVRPIYVYFTGLSICVYGRKLCLCTRPFCVEVAAFVRKGETDNGGNVCSCTTAGDIMLINVIVFVRVCLVENSMVELRSYNTFLLRCDRPCLCLAVGFSGLLTLTDYSRWHSCAYSI